ncbi:MAG TPA: hypothetical protein DCL44_10550 [Elusimicrobia bacterium]|nr:hypothetical protein [Elusimicrobiota bacterium]
MKRVLAAIALLGGLSLSASSAFAWDYFYTGAQHGNVFGTYKVNVNLDDYLPLQSGGSAKAMGMGGAYTAIASDLGAVEYNPAGLARISHVNVSALATANRTTTIGAQGEKTSSWKIIPTYAGAALKIGPIAVGLSKEVPQSKSTYIKFASTQRNIRAPDGWVMSYDTLSDKMDTSALDTYVLTGAIKLGRLSVGANYNSINGEIKREFSGRVTTPQRYYWWNTGGVMNNQFQATNTVGLKGYTIDVGALIDMGIIRLGATAKNFKGKVDVTQKMHWKDNFDMGSNNFFVWNPAQTKNTMTEFAPTYSAGAALLLGKFITVDLDYVTINLQDSNKALGRLGAEVAVIPGFLFARGGVKSDFKSVVQGQNNKTNEYFLGAGLKLVALTVDASASLTQAQAGSSGGDMTGAVSASLKF